MISNFSELFDVNSQVAIELFNDKLHTHKIYQIKRNFDVPLFSFQIQSTKFSIVVQDSFTQIICFDGNKLPNQIICIWYVEISFFFGQYNRIN